MTRSDYLRQDELLHALRLRREHTRVRKPRLPAGDLLRIAGDVLGGVALAALGYVLTVLALCL